MMNVTVTRQGQMLFNGATAYGHDVLMDAAVEGGGANQGPRPTELLLCGVGACSSMDVVETMVEKGQTLKSLKVEIRGERPSEYPMPFTDLYLHYIAEGEIDPAVFAETLHDSFTLYCAAGLSLKAEKHYTFEINGVQYPGN